MMGRFRWLVWCALAICTSRDTKNAAGTSDIIGTVTDVLGEPQNSAEKNSTSLSKCASPNARCVSLDDCDDENVLPVEEELNSCSNATNELVCCSLDTSTRDKRFYPDHGPGEYGPPPRPHDGGHAHGPEGSGPGFLGHRHGPHDGGHAYGPEGSGPGFLSHRHRPHLGGHGPPPPHPSHLAHEVGGCHGPGCHAPPIKKDQPSSVNIHFTVQGASGHYGAQSYAQPSHSVQVQHRPDQYGGHSVQHHHVGEHHPGHHHVGGHHPGHHHVGGHHPGHYGGHSYSGPSSHVGANHPGRYGYISGARDYNNGDRGYYFGSRDYYDDADDDEGSGEGSGDDS